MSLHDVWKGCREASVSVVDVEKLVMLILCVRTTAAVWQGCERRMGCYPLKSVSRRLLAAIAICPDTRGSQSAKALRGCVDIGHAEEFSCPSTGGALADERQAGFCGRTLGLLVKNGRDVGGTRGAQTYSGSPSMALPARRSTARHSTTLQSSQSSSICAIMPPGTWPRSHACCRYVFHWV